MLIRSFSSFWANKKQYDRAADDKGRGGHFHTKFLSDLVGFPSYLVFAPPLHIWFGPPN